METLSFTTLYFDTNNKIVEIDGTLNPDEYLLVYLLLFFAALISQCIKCIMTTHYNEFVDDPEN